ncbi:solute carrier family 22 member 16 [Ochotona princeps]|uniref:solute carrier family 22 member 16 n=1 Tax=Ochotona princeps TaxID=9978 RepID=UPI0027146222|nr:solute carrier family 22 member 16 [Ochotona princeps]
MKYPGVELIFDHVGHFGRFQRFIYFVCAFQSMSCGIHYVASMLLVISHEETCKPPSNVTKFANLNNSAAKLEDLWAFMSPGHKEPITVELQNGEAWDLSRCNQVHRDNKSQHSENSSSHDFSCPESYMSDQRQFNGTMNLICDQQIFTRMLQPFFMFGVLLGAIIFGYFSDKKGRQAAIWFTNTGIFLFGILATFTFNYYIFIISRFILAMLTSGYFVVGFVYVTEFVGRKSRTWASMNLHSFFAFGGIIVALMGFYVKTWWIYQVILCLATFPCILCCWMLPESPFWLISERKYEEAQELVDMMAARNSTGTCDLCEVLALDGTVDSKSPPAKKPDILDLFYSWNVTSGTLSIWLVWFTASFGFYSLSLKPARLDDRLYYFNVLLLAMLEIPAYNFTCVLVNKMGRRNGQAVFLFCIAIFCTIIIVLPWKYFKTIYAAIICVKFFVGSTFGLVFLYTAELYPTVVRSLAMGTSSMVCRLGSIFAPVALHLSNTWIYTPQLSMGVLAFLSGVASMTLRETVGKPLATTWEEMEFLEREGKSNSSKGLPTAHPPGLEDTEAVRPENPGLGT